MYESMFKDAIRALAAIDAALGMPEDGCNSPERTNNAIKLLHAAHKDDVADNERLRGELLLISQLQAGDGSTINGLTKDQLGRAFRQAQDIARAALGIVTHGDYIAQNSNPGGQGEISREGVARTKAVLNPGGRTGQGATVTVNVSEVAK